MHIRNSPILGYTGCTNDCKPFELSLKALILRTVFLMTITWPHQGQLIYPTCVSVIQGPTQMERLYTSSAAKTISSRETDRRFHLPFPTR